MSTRNNSKENSDRGEQNVQAKHPYPFKKETKKSNLRNKRII